MIHDVDRIERPVFEAFEECVLPVLRKVGPKIGDQAMNGDEWAKAVVQRYHVFAEGLASHRNINFRLLIESLENWTIREELR